MLSRTLSAADWNAIETAVVNSAALHEAAKAETWAHCTSHVSVYGNSAREPGPMEIAEVEVSGGVKGGELTNLEARVHVRVPGVFDHHAAGALVYKPLFSGNRLLEIVGEDAFPEESSDEDAGEQ